jgi:hypothetical protein
MKSKNPVILSVIHHRQNPLESTLFINLVIHLRNKEPITNEAYSVWCETNDCTQCIDVD